MPMQQMIKQLQKIYEETENSNFRKLLCKAISLLEHIDEKDLSVEEKEAIQTKITPFLKHIQSDNDLKKRLKQLRKSLMVDFGFVPPNYYLSLGTGIGVALGTSLGISMGIPFDNGIVFGPMLGSSFGLIGGLVIGMIMDKKKGSENRILKHL